MGLIKTLPGSHNDTECNSGEANCAHEPTAITAKYLHMFAHSQLLDHRSWESGPGYPLIDLFDSDVIIGGTCFDINLQASTVFFVHRKG